MTDTLLCLACYQDRLASVFDNADSFRIFKVESGNICPAGHISLPKRDPVDRTTAIQACGVKQLICGAICGCTLNMLVRSGINVTPWICGDVDVVLDAYRNDDLEALTMPGCRNRKDHCGNNGQRMHQGVCGRKSPGRFGK